MISCQDLSDIRDPAVMEVAQLDVRPIVDVTESITSWILQEVANLCIDLRRYRCGLGVLESRPYLREEELKVGGIVGQGDELARYVAFHASAVDLKLLQYPFRPLAYAHIGHFVVTVLLPTHPHAVVSLTIPGVNQREPILSPSRVAAIKNLAPALQWHDVDCRFQWFALRVR